MAARALRRTAVSARDTPSNIGGTLENYSMWKIMDNQWKIMETYDKSVENDQNDGSAVDLGIPSLKTNRYTNRREIMLLVIS